MLIGIDASRAFLEKRTGIEEYSYQVIKNLRNELGFFEVCLYVRKNQTVDFEIPANWKIKVISWHFFWTQAGLSLEMLFHPVDVLFVPAHTVPMIHPRKTIVTIHGLEYEFCQQAYSLWERIYMRISIRKSCHWASRIISVSENTKKDLMKLYKVPEEKIEVVYEGYDRERNFQFPISNFQKNAKYKIQDTKYILFLGRIEERKNIGNIIKAFEILKEKYNISHKLVLVGKPGFGYENLKSRIQNLKSKNDLIELGFVSEQEKWELLKKTEVFVFPTQYEGFGIPILEAQSVGCPVVASNNSSIPEVTTNYEQNTNVRTTNEIPTDCSAMLVDPQSPTEIAEAIFKIISNQTIKKDLIAKGLENVKRFSWEKCAREVAEILKK
ncbi:MAG: glycosyltransferase family 4 protein [Candidatus Moranbacteria bacterium]|nr:glycosyltransferase family 4 protein [Candidatus Moranbacteria bacterium]